MEIQKNLGIWIDHSIANLIDVHCKKKSHLITSEFTFETKEIDVEPADKLTDNQQYAFVRYHSNKVNLISNI